MSSTLLVSTRASTRLGRARAWLAQQRPAEPLTVVGHTQDAAAQLVRSLRTAAFGWERTTLFHLALSHARPRLLAEHRVLASPLALEALWARVVHELHVAGALGRYEPVAAKPGLVRALARTASEVRLGDVALDSLEASLAGALRAYEVALDANRLADRALVYRWAREAAPSRQAPLLLVDVLVEHRAEREFLRAVAASASEVLAVAPQSDAQSLDALRAVLAAEPRSLDLDDPGPLAALQRNLFGNAAPSAQELETPTGEAEVAGARGTAPKVERGDLLSAPGESREAVELGRALQAEARRGVRFDQMAIVLRAPGAYRAPLEAALRRCDIPAWFSRGTPKPDPAGRALLALLKCAEEKLSARRFSEYVSLGQVPRADAQGAPPAAAPREERYVAADGDEVPSPHGDKAPPVPAGTDEAEPVDVEAPVVAGTLRTPRKWELLLVDAAVIGGAGRWRDRLAVLHRKKQEELRAPDLTEAQTQRLERELGDLAALEAFALPLIHELEALPERAPWATWRDRLSALATRALRDPRRVLAVLQELAPMDVVGPVELREVRTVLTPRLSELTEAPPHRRAGHVFVGPVDAVRGLAFEVVLVPGLVERVFPQKLREDPLLSDAARRRVELPTNVERVAVERLALQLSVGAADRRALLSYPRIDAEHARPRVPSFYALEAIRAVEGKLPGFAELQRRAETAVQARLGWPAPKSPAEAVDDTEFDLAVLDGIFRGGEPSKGRARYLMDANPFVARALRARFARWTQPRWTPWDGLVAPPDFARPALAAHQFASRSWSPTALQHFAACPYRFFLSAIQRLTPLEIPDVIEQLGPLERGSLTHEVLFHVMTALRKAGTVLSRDNVEAAFPLLDETLARVARDYSDKFVPVIRRIWDDGIESIRADLRQVLRAAAEMPRWQPWRFELAFGLTRREEADESSTPQPVKLDCGVQVRGSIDLVERSQADTLRATDYKTGKARAEDGDVVGGGRQLQPLLYALVLEKLFPDQRVEAGRLFYCTQAGGFSAVEIPLTEQTRATVAEVMAVIGASLEAGFFPTAPDKGECRFCDFRAVCGPDEERRVKEKMKAGLEGLSRVRGLP